ncbi:glycoside hydrolase 5 family protein [Echinimonas agarilytica]|uniref:mannan endo-1,4-beta-mannosidase n=1 Tax=Echinimonas agarilytica TaxID=1215918 RepID=A0AA42B6I5_9GAMM|nr:cellulase family glycosylhydrolase [Echinimonas agarilytica]MCM2678699.1 cellulase family glycosylhydrolase [Echinimonas agarilytica]
MKKFKWIVALLTFSALILTACQNNASEPPEEKFVSVKNGEFSRHGQPYQFVGFNYWYGPLLGASKQGQQRLIRELDVMQQYGITNLRVLVGADGGKIDSMVTPALQYEQGIYNEKLLYGLDFLLAEMAKRDMVAVLYLTNNWIWSGGFAQYLEWNGYGPIPSPFLPPYDWEKFQNYTEQFPECEPCMAAFERHTRFIIGRTNSVTGIPYTDDPAIMSWQLANEPRVRNPHHEAVFSAWLNRSVDLIQSLDPNHLISTGAEGEAGTYKENPDAAGTYGDIEVFERVHANPNIDYLTIHVWPKNWSWYDPNNEVESTQLAINNAKDYIARHLIVAKQQKRPVVLSEFGFPRNQESLSRDSDVTYRNLFYQGVFSELLSTDDRTFAGVNIWGFGGEAKAVAAPNGKWMPGDDFSGDPPQEPQGLNSVFSSDTSTLELIHKFNIDMQQR